MSDGVKEYRIGDNEEVIHDHEERISWLEKVAWMGIGGVTTLSLMFGAWGFIEFVLQGI